MTQYDNLKDRMHYILPKKALTIVAGILANIKNTRIKNHLIRYFVRQYNINLSEAVDENPLSYADFNAFFIRHLKPSCRPIDETAIISPVDGYVSEIGTLNAGRLVQAKGRDYSIHELLASENERSSTFETGLFATLYLSPQDYHRVHMPMDATLKEMKYVPGKLFSVQPATTRMIPKLFARNERLIVHFDTSVGPMAMVLVGATIVGAIGTSWHGDVARSKKMQDFIYENNTNVKSILQKAEEMGYFKLGSTVILLFANKQNVCWHPALKSGDKIHFGQALAYIQ